MSWKGRKWRPLRPQRWVLLLVWLSLENIPTCANLLSFRILILRGQRSPMWPCPLPEAEGGYRKGSCLEEWGIQDAREGLKTNTLITLRYLMNPPKKIPSWSNRVQRPFYCHHQDTEAGFSEERRQGCLYWCRLWGSSFHRAWEGECFLWVMAWVM